MEDGFSQIQSNISTTCYGHAGVCCDFSCFEQSLPVMSVGFLKILAHAVYYQAYYARVIRDEKPMLLLNSNNMVIV